MNSITKFSLKNPFAVFILAFLLIVGGLYSFRSLKVDLLPDIEFPQLTIQVIYPGASPQDVDEQVTKKLENELKSIEDLKTMSSSSLESTSIITLTFPFNTDLEKIKQQVNDEIDKLDLPENAETRVDQFSFGAVPIYNISLFAKDNTNIEQLLEESILPELKKINGISSVSVGGANEEFVQITVDKEKAQQAGLTLEQIKQTINNKFLSFPAGAVTAENVQIPVRVEDKVKTIDELKKLSITPMNNAGQGGPNAMAVPVTLEDISVIKANTRQNEYTRYNDQTSLSISVSKKQTANTVEVADQVVNVLNKYKKDMDYVIGFDQATNIKDSVTTLIKEGLFGALFASLSVLLFLRNVRATLIAIISIPLSLLITAIFLKELNITLNIMTLGGMAVAVGRVVDDSIVVIENIFRRIRKSNGEENKDELIVSSTQEILKAITSSTITTVVVFLPLGLVGGITSQFFLPFALTVVFALLTSLVVAITIVPMLSKFSFKKVKAETKEGKVTQLYASLLQASLRHKGMTIGLSIALLIGSLFLVKPLGFVFLPNEKQKSLIAQIEMPSSTPLDQTNAISLEAEKMLLNKKSIDDVTISIGSRDFATGLKRQNLANYFINLKDGSDIDKEIKAIEKDLNDVASRYSKKAIISVQEAPSGGPPSSNKLTIDLFSNDLDALEAKSKEVEALMKQEERLKYVTNNFQEKQQQWLVSIDSEKASNLAISNFMILGLVSDQTKPVSVGNLVLDGKEQNIELAYNRPLVSKEELENILVFSNQGPIPLKEVAKVEEVNAVTSIQKLDGKVYAQVSAQIDDKNLRQVTNDVKANVNKEIDFPDTMNVRVAGDTEDAEETFQSLGLAMIVAIGLVYVTMLITFGQARIPLIILSSLVFVPIGSFGGLFISGEPLSVSAMIGILMLIGIVTTNAIVLVDRIGQNRMKKGMKIEEALVEAGKTRLRPILMTAFATIAALLPLAFTTSSGTLISKGLAIVVIGGLTTSTLLTLILVPVLYELFFFRQVKKEKMATK